MRAPCAFAARVTRYDAQPYFRYAVTLIRRLMPLRYATRVYYATPLRYERYAYVSPPRYAAATCYAAEWHTLRAATLTRLH